jgi:hypothetical protein
MMQALVGIQLLVFGGVILRNWNIVRNQETIYHEIAAGILNNIN